MFVRCPFCGNKDRDRFNLLGGERVECDVCGSSGPLGNTEEEAETAWNQRTPMEHLINLLEQAEGRVMLVHTGVDDYDKKDLDHVINLLNDAMAELKGGME
jgi:Lar family restriction alleviation protein